MENKVIRKLSKSLKKGKKLKKYSRKVNSYSFKDVIDYNKLKPFTYTILRKPAYVATRINGKVESNIKLSRGDFVMCGPKGEKYGLNLEKVLNTYNLGNIENKKVERMGFKLTSKQISKCKLKKTKNIQIVPSWGGIQTLKKNDYIMFENNGRGYYAIDDSSFKKTYN